MTTIAQFNAELDKYVGYNGSGTLDNPDTIFGAWFGINGPGAGGQWCDMYLDYCANKVGLQLFPEPRGSAGVFNTWDAYRQAGRTFQTPQRGDLIVFTFSHIGFVEKVDGNTLTTIQGNTIGVVDGVTQYGNTCRRKTVVLPNSTVKGFCRPSYTTATTTPPSEGDVFDMAEISADALKQISDLFDARLKHALGGDYASPAGSVSSRTATKVRDMQYGTGAIWLHGSSSGGIVRSIADKLGISIGAKK